MDENEIINELDNIFAEYILVGLTHVQYKKGVDYSLIVNPGSVELARDGGQACYAVYGKNGILTLKRIDYDVERTINDLMKTPSSDNVKNGLKNILLHK